MKENQKSTLPCVDFKIGPNDDPLPFDLNAIENMGPLTVADYPHRHSFYEILYVTGGKGSHIIDFISFPIHPPQLYFISPGQVHFWDTKGEITGKLILFTDDFLRVAPEKKSVQTSFSFFHTFNHPPSLELKPANRPEIEALFKTIEDEFTKDRFSRATLLWAYLHILLVKIQRQYDEIHPEASSTRISALFNGFMSLVSKHVVVERSPGFYASLLGITSGHLSEAIKKASGQTP